jgi:hypothetical protein
MTVPHVYLLALTALAMYVAGVSALTTRVSYPLYAAVPAEAFVAYHQRYNRQILPVIVVPGFVCFLGCLAFPLVRPGAVPVWLALPIAAGGLTALLATGTAAIPSHLRLQHDGFAAGPYRRLRAADRIRTAACLGSAALLGWGLVLAFIPR